MDKRLRLYLWVQSLIVLAINALINGFIAWFLNREGGIAALDPAALRLTLAVDILITCPILGALNGGSAASDLKKKKAVAVLPAAGGLLGRLAGIGRRPYPWGMALGLGAAPLLFGLTVGGMAALGATGMSLWGYILYKAAYAGLLAGALTALFLAAGLHAPRGAA